MEILYFIISGIAGGIIGGMGMGGGTLLIPLLTIFLYVPQKTAQGINLIAFLPMAIVALIIHFKNKLVDFKNLLYIVIPGIIASVSFSFLASSLDNEILSFLFGNFLILIGVYETLELIFEILNKKQQKKNNKRFDNIK